jgi:ribosomal protein S6
MASQFELSIAKYFLIRLYVNPASLSRLCNVLTVTQALWRHLSFRPLPDQVSSIID